MKDSKAQLRHENRHLGGTQFGETNGHGNARELIPDEREQAAIVEILARREAVHDAMRAQGFPISHQLVADLERRARAE